MLDFSFSELLLVLIAAVIFIGPKDLPVVIRHLKKFMRELREVSASLRAQVKEVMDEAGLDDLARETTTIIDLEGKSQRAYNVDELKTLEAPKADAQK